MSWKGVQDSCDWDGDEFYGEGVTAMTMTAVALALALALAPVAAVEGCTLWKGCYLCAFAL